MRLRLGWLQSAALAICAFAAASGCEWVAGDLPAPGLSPVSDSGAGGSGGSAAPGGSGGGSDIADAEVDVQPFDASESGVAGGSSDGAVPTCADPCDCDGDHARAKGDCGGDDCDDDDARAHPGQTEYFTTAAPSAGFDFNCDGATDRDPQLAKEHTCTGVSLLLCDDVAQGYLDGLPECGMSGPWGTCHKGTLACESDVRESRPMACH